MAGEGSPAFRTFGRLEAVAGGTALEMPAGGASALLAYLLLRPGELVGRDRLIEELWGEARPRSAVNAVHVYVSSLRRALGPAGDALVTAEHSYVLAVERGDVDLHRFRDLVRDGRRTLDDARHETAARLFEQALALWTGPPFAGLERWPFVVREADELEAVRLDALEGRLEAALGLGRHAEVAAEVGDLIAQEPHRESLRAILMLALYRSGRQADALAAYRDARRLLGEELGIEPSRRLKDLEAAILCQDPALEPAPAETVRRLPVPPTQLIGRADELAYADAALRGGTRLLTLVGPGGIGKTRLALEIARLEANVPVTLVALETITEPERVEPTIAAALGLNPNRVLVEQLDDRARLLVLDNFEQVVDAAPLLASILAATTRLRLIVTSRILLRLTGEEAVPVPPLARHEAAALFFRRASALGTRLDEEAEGTTVDAICACLDDLPLAIELAAARTKLFAPAALLERLSQRLDMLTSGARDAPARQRTMRATIDWSFRLLTPREQAIVESLAVFVGGASLAAAAAVCGEPPPELADAVESLIEKSLVEAVGRTPLRLRMLEVVREYALEKTDGSERGRDLRARHVAFFRVLAEAAETGIESALQRETAAELELEHDNIRAALAHAFEADPVSAVRIVASLRHFWRIHGHFRAGGQWLQQAAATAPEDDPDTLSKIYNGIGIMLGEQGEFEAARVAFERSLASARRADEPSRVARVVSNLGNIALYRGDYAEARELYTEALEINRRLGDLQFLATNLQNRGATLLCEGEIPEAIVVLEESLDTAREIAVPHVVAQSTRELARALVLAGDIERAAEDAVRSLEISVELDDINGVAQALEVLTGIATREGDDAYAQRAYALAEELRRPINSRAAPDEIRWLKLTGFEPPAFPVTLELAEPTLADAAALAAGLVVSGLPKPALRAD